MAAERSRPRAGGALPLLPPVFALVELAIFGAVVVAEYGLTSFPDITKLNPHPYWLPVLLISLQYGTLSGLLTAAIAILGTILIGLPEQDIGEAYFNYMIRAWAQPVLWLVVALLLGSFRMRQIEQRDDLLHQVEDMEQQWRVVDEHAGELQLRCDELERELVTKARPETERMLDGLVRCSTGAITSADIDAVLDAALPGAEASLYVRAGNGLQLVHAHRWPEGAKWPRVISGLDPLALSIVGAGRRLTILAAGDERALATHGLAAVPIVDGSGPIGMLKVEALPASAVVSETTARLAVLAAHMTRAVHALGTGMPAPEQSAARVVPIPRLVRRPVVAGPAVAPVRAVANDGAG